MQASARELLVPFFTPLVWCSLDLSPQPPALKGYQQTKVATSKERVKTETCTHAWSHQSLHCLHIQSIDLEDQSKHKTSGHGIAPHICPLCTVESSKFEVLWTRGLFRSIEYSNYREVDIKIYNPQKDYHFFFSVKHKLWVCKRNVSMRRFFYAPKTYVIIDNYLNIP